MVTSAERVIKTEHRRRTAPAVRPAPAPVTRMAIEGGASIAIMDAREAGSEIIDLYQRILGRSPAAADLNYWKSQLRGRESLAQVGMAIATSSEASAKVLALYRQVLDRDAGAREIAYWQQQLATASSLDDVQSGLAHSREATQLLADVCQRAFGQAPNSTQLIAYQTQLAMRGGSLRSIEEFVLAQREAVTATPDQSVPERTNPDSIVVVGGGLNSMQRMEAWLTLMLHGENVGLSLATLPLESALDAHSDSLVHRLLLHLALHDSDGTVAS